MTLQNVIRESTKKVATKAFKENKWGERHRTAFYAPTAVEEPIVRMYEALALYADRHFARYESKIGEDGVLGPAFLDMLKGLRALLNGELGRLDGGTLDALYWEMGKAAGFDDEDLN